MERQRCLSIRQSPYVWQRSQPIHSMCSGLIGKADGFLGGERSVPGTIEGGLLKLFFETLRILKALVVVADLGCILCVLTGFNVYASYEGGGGGGYSGG